MPFHIYTRGGPCYCMYNTPTVCLPDCVNLETPVAISTLCLTAVILTGRHQDKGRHSDIFS